MHEEISYLTIIATACATACFMIALMHVVMWHRSRRQPTYLWSTIMAASAGFVAILDLRQMRVQDVDTYVQLSLYMHIALFMLLVSLATFVRSYLRAGPGWLIVVIGALWAVALIQSAVLPYGVVHSEITEIAAERTAWGETFSVVRGTVNPGKYVADASALLTIVFLAIAILEASRSRRRKRALVIGGSLVFFLVVGVIVANLEDLGIVAVPFFLPIAFLAVIATLSYQILDDAFQANAFALEVAQLRRAIVLGEMVGGFAHEINQPLSAILSNAQAARRILDRPPVDQDEVREIIEDIIADDKRASGIILRLRGMLERSTPKDSVVDATEAMAAASELVKGECHSQDVSLRTDLQMDNEQIRADAVELEQVLLNLLLNAVRAAATNGAAAREVTLACRQDGRYAQFSITDNGPGIREDMMETLFEPFVSGTEGGLGIGLAICKRIVERAGGVIWAEQREEGGAAFHFTMPLAGAGAKLE